MGWLRRWWVVAALPALALGCRTAPATRAPAEAPAPASAPKQPATAKAPLDLSGAVGLLVAGKAKAAAARLEALAKDHPDNGHVWLLLGQARKAAGDVPGAVKALGRAAALPATAGKAHLVLGLLYAGQGDTARAFHHLLAARDSGQVDVTQVGLSPAAKRLARDPRYRTLFPSPAELAHPFVEPARVIHAWDGEAKGDQFGWIARNLGDVDHDGIDDVVTSAPTCDDGGKDAGKVYVYSGKGGGLLWAHGGSPGAHLGTGLEAAGDVDGDGVPDVVAGAPKADRVLVLSGKDGHVLRTLAGEAGTGFGQAVSGIGDADGDGRADLVVGAPRADHGAGAAFVYSGATGKRLVSLAGSRAGDAFGSAVDGAFHGGRGLLVVGAGGGGPHHHGRVRVYRKLGPTPAFTLDARATGRRLGGMFVSVVGDVDGDGQPDVYASDWRDATRGPLTGRIYVVSGADGHLLWTRAGDTAGAGFGIGSAEAGDLDHDGHDDLVVGAWQYAGAAPAGGRVQVLSGRDGHPLWTLTGRVMGETLGFDATTLADVDGDGVRDLLLTAAWSPRHGAHSGRVYLISGALPSAATNPAP